jgi:hypothetical protein
MKHDPMLVWHSVAICVGGAGDDEYGSVLAGDVLSEELLPLCLLHSWLISSLLKSLSRSFFSVSLSHSAVASR